MKNPAEVGLSYRQLTPHEDMAILTNLTCFVHCVWEPRKEDNLYSPHGCRVENIHGPLMSQGVPIRAHDILDDTEDRSRNDQAAAAVEHHQPLFPWNIWP